MSEYYEFPEGATVSGELGRLARALVGTVLHEGQQVMTLDDALSIGRALHVLRRKVEAMEAQLSARPSAEVVPIRRVRPWAAPGGDAA